jgi:hypothetical protein
MKTLFYFAIGLFATFTFAQNDSSQDIWYNLQTPANDAVAFTGIPDTPFILKNIHGTPTDYTLPVYFDAIKSDKVSDVIIDIIQMSASFDRRGNKMIYLKGQIDLSCCFDGPMTIDFLDADDNLVQKASTDANGVFKIKSINGNLFVLKNNKLKFNFTKLKTFDQNADIRFAEVKRLKRPLESELETVQEKSIANKNKP